MNPAQNSLPLPFALAESAQDRAAIGELVAGLREHPGWDALMASVEQYRLGCLGTFPMCKDGYPYAEFVGELKGLAALDAIASGLVAAGETAATEIRAAEGGS